MVSLNLDIRCEVAYITFCMKNRGVSIHFFPTSHGSKFVSEHKVTLLRLWSTTTHWLATAPQHCLKMFIMGQKFEEVFRHISTKRQRACQSAYYSHVKTSKTVLALTDASQFQTQLMYLEVTKYGNTSHTYHVDDQEMWPIKLPFKMRQNNKCIQKTTLFCG